MDKRTSRWRTVAHNYFDVIDTAEKAYILGLLAADGNVSDKLRITFGLQAKDADHVRFVRDRLAPDAGLCIAKRDEFVSFSYKSTPACAGLAQWGVVPRKSRSLPWPALPEPMLRPYLLGYFDGDGSACVITRKGGERTYPNWSICSGSERFLVYMKVYILDSTGVALDKIQHRAHSSLYQVMVTGRGAWIIDGWLHQDDGLGFARKRFPAHATDRYLAPAPPTDAEVLAARVQAAGTAGLTRRQISVQVFTCNRDKMELDAIMAEVLAMPGYHVEKRRTVGTHCAKFLYYETPEG